MTLCSCRGTARGQFGHNLFGVTLVTRPGSWDDLAVSTPLHERPSDPLISSWPQVLGRLTEGVELAPGEAAWAMDQIMSGEATPAQDRRLRRVDEDEVHPTAAEVRELADTMLRFARRCRST